MQPFNWPRAHNLSPNLTAVDFPTFVKSVSFWDKLEEIINLKSAVHMTIFLTLVTNLVSSSVEWDSVPLHAWEGAVYS